SALQQTGLAARPFEAFCLPGRPGCWPSSFGVLGGPFMEWIGPALVLVGVLTIWATVTQMSKRLERAERKLNALLRHFSIDSTQGVALSDRVKELARDPRRKIEAIKVYREETGAGLAEAKEAVEAFMNSL